MWRGGNPELRYYCQNTDFSEVAIFCNQLTHFQYKQTIYKYTNHFESNNTGIQPLSYLKDVSIWYKK